MQLPPELKNVMITYEAIICSGPYGDTKRKEIVTRRAFYSKSDGYYNRNNKWIETPDGTFSVPQYWTNFTFSDGSVALLPKGFYQYPRVYPNQILKWELTF